MLIASVCQLSYYVYPLFFFVCLFFQAVVVISFASLTTLAFCAEVTQTGTVQELMQEMTGPLGGLIADAVVFFYALAGCITYVAVIGDQIEDCE